MFGIDLSTPSVSVKGRHAGLVLCLGIIAVSAYIAIVGVGNEAVLPMQASLSIAGSLAAYFFFLLSAVFLGCILTSYWMVANDMGAASWRAFYLACPVCFLGLVDVLLADNLLVMLVSLELAYLVYYYLAGAPQSQRSLFTSYQHYLVGTLAALIILTGLAVLYASTGTLNLLVIANLAPAEALAGTISPALGMVIFGLILKAGAFPLHMVTGRLFHLPAATVLFFISTTSIIVCVYLLIRVVAVASGLEIVAGLWLLYIFGAIGIIVPAVLAYFSISVRQFLLYVTLSQVGYMLAGIAAASPEGVTGAVTHVVNHLLVIVTFLLAFGAAGALSTTAEIADLNGLAKRMPWHALAIAVAGASLLGLPLTAGFISKWYLILSALAYPSVPVVVAMIAGMLITALYVWKLIEIMYFNESSGSNTRAGSSWPGVIWILAALIIAIVYLGIDTRLTAGFTGLISEQLIGSGT